MPTATVYRDGKPIRTTTLTAAQGDDFVILAQAVRQAQAVLHFDPATPGTSYKAGNGVPPVGGDELHGASIYSVLPKIADLIGGSSTSIRDEYPHLLDSVHSGPNEDSFLPFWKNLLDVPKTHRAAALVSQATTLGMLPLDGLKFDYAELTDPAPVGSGVPQLRAFVRWRA